MCNYMVLLMFPPEYLSTENILHMQLRDIYKQMAFQIQKYQNAHFRGIFVVREALNKESNCAFLVQIPQTGPSL